MSENNDPEITIPKATKEPTKSVINPLLERARLPGDTFRLPSCGVFYTNGELDDETEDGEVHVYPMTGIDEITISSAAKLFSGDGIIEVLSRCVPAIIKPKELLAQDVDFLMLALRKVSYGPTADFDKIHEDCSAEREENVPLRKQSFQANIAELLAQTKEIKHEDVATAYRVELDNGQIVKLAPMRFGPYIRLMQIVSQDIEGLKDENVQFETMMGQLADMITSVDEVADRAMIREWLGAITAGEVKKINEAISEMSVWGVNSKFKVKCRDCKEEMEVELPTNPLVLFS